MAVVQISRIQIRRGKAQEGTGIPQLASGEMAWAIDTQELFIGNGAVSEGAPGVGNTKILTTNDFSLNSNFLGLVQYVYRGGEIQTGPSTSESISRTLQDRLDDQITALDFGTVGDYNISSGFGADDTSALQRAIDQLFLNAVSKASDNGPDSTYARIILKIPAGTYKLTRTLYIPSYASLIGDGADKTTIYYDPETTVVGSIDLDANTLITDTAADYMVGASVTGTGIPADTLVTSVVTGAGGYLILNNFATATTTGETYTVIPAGPAIQLVNDLSTIGTPSSLESTLGTIQPRNIQISGLTIHTPTGQNTCLQLDAVRECLFEDLNLRGDWNGTFNALSCGVTMNAVSSVEMVTTENNIFRNIRFTDFSYAVFAKYDITNNIFENCFITNSRQGFVLGLDANGTTIGQQTGPKQTQIINCKFYDVKRHGVLIDLGTSNTVSNCKFDRVGVDGADNTTPSSDAIYPQIFFNTYGNTVHNIQSDRADDLSDPDTTSTLRYIPEFAGRGVYESYGTRSVYLSPQYTGGGTPIETPVIRLPVSTSEIGNPSGSISYVIKYFYKSSNYTRSGTLNLTADIDTKRVQLSDEYNVAVNDPNNTIALQLDFSADLIDITGSIITPGGVETPYSIHLNQTNTESLDVGYFNYSYSAIV